MILTKYVFDLGVRLTEFSITVESVYCTYVLYVLFCCCCCKAPMGADSANYQDISGGWKVIRGGNSGGGGGGALYKNP